MPFPPNSSPFGIHRPCMRETWTPVHILSFCGLIWLLFSSRWLATCVSFFFHPSDIASQNISGGVAWMPICEYGVFQAREFDSSNITKQRIQVYSSMWKGRGRALGYPVCLSDSIRYATVLQHSSKRCGVLHKKSNVHYAIGNILFLSRLPSKVNSVVTTKLHGILYYRFKMAEIKCCLL